MKLYGIKSCDACRKAVRTLRENGREVEVIDVRDDGVPPAELARFYETFGEDLINRRSTTWRNLSAEEREGDALSLFKTHPTLMKRPIIDAYQTLYIGWKSDVQTSLLG